MKVKIKYWPNEIIIHLQIALEIILFSKST